MRAAVRALQEPKPATIGILPRGLARELRRDEVVEGQGHPIHH
jgi:hypothetical protein